MPKAVALFLLLGGTVSARMIEDAMKTETRESLALTPPLQRSKWLIRAWRASVRYYFSSSPRRVRRFWTLRRLSTDTRRAPRLSWIPQVVNIGTSLYGASTGWKYRRPPEIEMPIDKWLRNDAKGEKPRLVLTWWVRGEPFFYMCSRCGQPFLFPEDRSPKERGQQTFGRGSANSSVEYTPR